MPEMSESSIVRSYCRSCNAPIHWAETKAGKLCPFDIVNGQPTKQSHFGTCPDAKRWTKKGTKS